MQTGGGFFVISLDFELYWGMFDKVTLAQYGENMMGVKKALPEILLLFNTHEIHATWATVGMLMCKNKDELFEMIPRESLQPRYENMAVSSYTHFQSTHIGTDEKNDPYHFSSSLVSEIINSPNQELASHTFSHYYCIDGENNKPSVFDTDLELQQQIFKAYGIAPESIIFPRNQVTNKALLACSEHGITSYRGAETHFIYRPRRDDKQSLFVRGLRLLDAYFNISGHNTVSLDFVSKNDIHNIPSSRFLRPYSEKLRFFEPKRIKRIKDSMTHAAKNNEIFHLWWHPHNFGINRAKNMKNLQELINHYETLKETYGMQSRNMREISAVASDTSTDHSFKTLQKQKY